MEFLLRFFVNVEGVRLIEEEVVFFLKEEGSLGRVGVFGVFYLF